MTKKPDAVSIIRMAHFIDKFKGFPSVAAYKRYAHVWFFSMNGP